MCGLWLLLLAAGCGGQTGEMPLQPDGPLVDFTERVDEVAVVFGGSRPGEARDGGGDEPCAIDGAAFTLVSEVGDPSGCTDHEDSTTDSCESATEASFALDGSIDFGDGAPVSFGGHIGIWSEPDGLMLFKSLLTPPDGDDANQNLDLLVDGRLLDEAVFTGLSWTRRLSEEEDETTIWEICTLAFTE
jgi:hypothetical protein